MSTPEQKLKKLENLLNLLDESLTKEEFVKSFEAVVNLILKVQKDLQDKNEVAIDSLEKMFEKLALKLESANKEDITEIKVKIEGALKDQQAGMNLIYDKMKDITGFDIKKWINENVNWKEDFDDKTMKFF